MNHKDRNRANPKVENLEWVTYSENVRHSIENGGRSNYTRNNKGTRNSNARLAWKTVCAIRDLYKSGNYSQNELGRIFNMSQSRVQKIVNRKAWKTES